MERYSISNTSIVLDLKPSLSLSVMSNKVDYIID